MRFRRRFLNWRGRAGIRENRLLGAVHHCKTAWPLGTSCVHHCIISSDVFLNYFLSAVRTVTILKIHYRDPEHEYPDQEIIDQLRPDSKTFLKITDNEDHLHSCLKNFKSELDKGRKPSIETYRKKIANVPIPDLTWLGYSDA